MTQHKIVKIPDWVTPETEEYLTEIGRQGWELVHVYNQHAYMKAGTAGTGGSSIGGNGSITASTTGTSGTTNRGAGGGGGGSTSGVANSSGGAGGSGVVIIKIPDSRTATFTAGVTQTSVTSGGFKVYTITATSNTSQTVTFT